MNPLIKKIIDKNNSITANSSMVGEELSAKVAMWIPSGSYILDTTISNDWVGGWPCGRIVEIYGIESIGKSSLCFQAMANTQKNEGISIFYDVEQAGAYAMMKACGVKTDELVYNNQTSIEEIFNSLEETLKLIAADKSMKNKPVLAVVDSIAALVTDAEIEAGYENNMNLGGLKPKQLGHALRKITPYLTKTNCCLILTNQIRQKIGIAYGDPEYAPGGKAKDFFASVRVKLLGREPITLQDDLMTPEEYKAVVQEWKLNGKIGDKPKKPKGEKYTIGNNINCKLVKNKVGMPYREAKIRLVFLEGIQEEWDILEYAIELDIIKKSGAWNTFNTNDKNCPIPIGTNFQDSEWLDFIKDTQLYDFLKYEIQKSLIKVKKQTDVEEPETEPELD